MRLRSLLILFFAASLSLFAQKASELPDPYDGYDEILFMDMDLDQNIETPKLQDAERKAVKKHMSRMANELAHARYVVDLDRDGEVVVVTIPTDDLFLPNDTLLSPKAEVKLKPLLKYLSDPGLFKVVYTIHTDDTGSPDYLFDLSQQRVNSVYDWMLDFVSEDQVIIPYSMGDIDPVETNSTRVGRRANRRMEFYFIPGPEMILKARKGKLQ
ncbi:MAG: OmpA family protein [Muribaculaceae bacterium]|nr:OmpA family protein [Muribaculaceae bacterium]